ncbi:MAG: methyltransferase domain-containing protein [Cytophagaceae bacterium]|nr:methyltransferase domain-containing protein [Cytophagaceae bacterium]
MFRNRSTTTEIMDDLDCKGEVVVQTLRELEFINEWLGGNNVTLGALKKCVQQIDGENLTKPLHISDLGCGSGDMLKLIAKKARRENYKVELTGVDANPFIIDYAKKHSEKFPEIKYIDANVFSEKFKNEKFDIVNCTLFCHHFTNQELTDLLSQLRKQCRHAVIINDLHRHWLAYHSIKFLTQLFSKSAMVKNDAKLSVLRGFTKDELKKIIQDTGFSRYTIEWKWAFRFQIILWI